MGMNMMKRLKRGGHTVAVWDLSEDARKQAAAEGAIVADGLSGFKAVLPGRSIVWVMVPSGKVTEETVHTVAASLTKGDIIIDGGNSNYKDSQRLGLELAKSGISFLDSGTSGGVWGLENGYCLMIGGDEDAFKYVEPIFKTLAPENGYERTGPSGAGHFVKMVHNGIEYAMMQSYAEGFEILQAKKEFGLDLQKISALWNRGSVVRSWLLELLDDAFQKDGDLSTIKGYVEDSGEGRWTVNTAIELSVPAPLIALSLFERFRSRQEDSFGNRVLAALRNEFGGHRVVKK
jgi:6-phosphogluconate dehydrogenase